MEKNLRVVFMGTPDFALASLKTLHESKHQVLGVVTAVDKPAGRGRKLQESAVKRYAVNEGIPVLQPANLKNEVFQEELRALGADLFVVVAFRMLPKSVWNMPELGTFNIHASLLPQYRGAAPINWAIINGETKTGVTSFFIDDQIDTGHIIASKEIEIGQNDCAGDLHDKLMHLGALLCLETTHAISQEQVHPRPQKEHDKTRLKSAPKIYPEHRTIDWSRPAEEIRNLVRGMSPYPGATSSLHMPEGERISVKIFEVEVQEESGLTAGEIDSDGKTYIKVGTTQMTISILSMQMPGKKRMKIRDILNGNRIEKGAFFSSSLS